jgi:hypothetical protein
MIQNVLRNIGGVGIYGVISICLFLLVFGGALIWALLLKKPFLNSMSSLPLEEENASRTPDEPIGKCAVPQRVMSLSGEVRGALGSGSAAAPRFAERDRGRNTVEVSHE